MTCSDSAPYRIGLIGTGRVARALAASFSRIDSVTLSIWGRDPHAAGVLANSSSATLARSPDDILKEADCVLLAVSDDALSCVIDMLTAGPKLPARPLVCHVSGRSGAAILAPLSRRDVRTAAIHPAMTFIGDPHAERARMNGACFAVTTPDPAARDAAHALVALLGGVPVDVTEEHRPLYHAALSHAANHLVTLLSGAQDMLRACGIAQPSPLLAPLVRAALENTLSKGFEALSGPLLRGDGGTIESHLRAIAEDSPAQLLPYRAMALATLDELERQDREPDTALRRRLT